MKMPVIVQAGAPASGVVNKILAGSAVVGLLYFGNKQLKQYLSNKQQEKAAEDPNTNMANQLFSELEKVNPDDAVLLSLFRQIGDFKAVSAAYKTISQGKDLINHLQNKTFVDAETVQIILRELGLKTGAVKATSPAVQTATQQATSGVPGWIIAKSTVRIRKSPKAYSVAHMLLKPPGNVIENAQPDEVVGFLNIEAWNENGKKPLYDAEHNTFFFPVKIFVGNARVVKSAFVAASEVRVVFQKSSPSAAKIFSDFKFNTSVYLNGLGCDCKRTGIGLLA